MSSRLILARCTVPSVWTEDAWSAWCESAAGASRILKADLPHNDSRAEEAAKVRKWNMKRPSAAVKKRLKRTVFTVSRRTDLRTQGARRRN